MTDYHESYAEEQPTYSHQPCRFCNTAWSERPATDYARALAEEREALIAITSDLPKDAALAVARLRKVRRWHAVDARDWVERQDPATLVHAVEAELQAHKARLPARC